MDYGLDIHGIMINFWRADFFLLSKTPDWL
jgi:hypothetical protein